MNFKKILVSSLSLLFTAQMSSIAMKENVNNIEEKEEKQKKNKEIKNPCPICYDFDLDDPGNEKDVIKLNCNPLHLFCANCMSQMKDTDKNGDTICPLCRRCTFPLQKSQPEAWDMVVAENLPQMKGKSNEEILDKLFDMLKNYKGVGIGAGGEIRVSDFWPMRSDMIRYDGSDYILPYNGRRCTVFWPFENQKLLKEKIKVFNNAKLKEEEERWKHLTADGFKQEKIEFEQYLNRLSVKTISAQHKLTKEKIRELVNAYAQKVEKTMKSGNLKERKKHKKIFNTELMRRALKI